MITEIGEDEAERVYVLGCERMFVWVKIDGRNMGELASRVTYI